jgi:hypothetical protein
VDGRSSGPARSYRLMARAAYVRGSFLARLWAKIDVRGPGECWPWTASLSSTGYGQINQNGKPQRAHRAVLLEAWPFFPHGTSYHACHSCDNKLCCNPAHLYWGTRSDNMRDSRDRNRVGGRQKLTAEQADVIRGSAKRVSELCAEFGISRWQVTNIRSGRQWTRD